MDRRQGLRLAEGLRRPASGSPSRAPRRSWSGPPLHPAAVTGAFHLLAHLAGLPPIRLHDLRRGAATLLLAAGHDMKVVQETLGLSSITIAADTYTSVLPELARWSAEGVAALIRPGRPGPRRDRHATPGSGHRPQAQRQDRPEVRSRRKVNTMTISRSQPQNLRAPRG